MHFCSSSQSSISPAQQVGWQLLEVCRKQEGTLMFSVAPTGSRTGKGNVSGFMDTLQPSFRHKHGGCIFCSEKCHVCYSLRRLRDGGEASVFWQRNGKW